MLSKVRQVDLIGRKLNRALKCSIWVLKTGAGMGPPPMCTCLVYFTEEALRKMKYKSIQRKKNTVASLKGIWHVSLEIN